MVLNIFSKDFITVLVRNGRPSILLLTVIPNEAPGAKVDCQPYLYFIHIELGMKLSNECSIWNSLSDWEKIVRKVEMSVKDCSCEGQNGWRKLIPKILVEKVSHPSWHQTLVAKHKVSAASLNARIGHWA